MNDSQAGLQLRLRRVLRQITAQHRHLKPIYGVLEAALERGASDETRVAFEQYREAIEAHFSLEEEFFFPALHGLHPERTRELVFVSDEHQRLLAALRGIAESVRAADLAAAAADLAAFRDALGAHEEREERLVASMGKRAG